jgi:hypothetical protein
MINLENICIACVQPCFECLNATYCLSCQIGYQSQVFMGKCVSTCENGYYAKNSINPNYTDSSISMKINKICELCLAECLTCKNGQTCISCKNSNLVLDPGFRCSFSCPSGYYNNQQICSICTYPCLTCGNGPKICMSCIQPFILSGESCISQCGVTEYLKLSECFPCVWPCRTCIN